jgi:zinc protease
MLRLTRLASCIAVALTLLAVAPRARAADLALDYREIKLKNGMKVITLEDFGCPIVAVQLWFHVGSKNELPERQGFAHMFEHMMFRGTDRLGSTDHFDFIRRTGGSCNAYTSFDNTTYIQELPANQLELVLWLEAERFNFLKIDQKNYDTERKVVEEERRLGLNRPYGTVLEKALVEIFPSHPYRWSPIGKIPHLRAAPVQELRDFWARYYIPNNCTLVIVGAVKHEDAQKLAKRYFEWIPRDAEPPEIKTHDPLPTKARTVTIREENAPAPGVGIVWRTVPSKHDDYVPLQLLSTILGGGESSRLYREIVADKQLGAFAGAFAFSLEQDGLVGAGAVMAPFSSNTDKIIESINRQVERLRTEPIKKDELLKAKNQMLAQVVTGSLTVASKATLLGNAAVIEGDTSRVNRRLSQIRAVTAEDIQRVAKEYLAPERSLTIKVEQNLLGSVLGKLVKGKSEDDAPITAKPETTAAPPAKPGLRRPADFPEKPPVATANEPKFPRDFKSQTLPNGLKVYAVSKRQVPYVNISLGFKTGAWTEDKPGTVSLAAGMLTKGTDKHTEKQLADELETYAISLSGSGGMDSASVNAGCLSEHLDRAIDLMAEVVLTPTFPDAEFDKLKKQVRTSLAVSQAEPGFLANTELERRLYGKHPYARPVTGTTRDVDARKVADLRDWWKKFARPDGAVLIFSGDIEPERAFKLAEKAFGSWKAEGPRPALTLADFPKPEATHIYLVDHPGVQSQIRVGQLSIKRDHARFPVSRVVNNYFGMGFGSRLNETVRVKKGLTYGARGGYYPYRFTGAFELSTFSKNETTAKALEAMLDELKRLKEEPPSAKELDDTKSYLSGKVAGDRETPSAIAGDIWQIEMEGLPIDYHEKLLAAITRTSKEECIELVKETVDPTKLVIVIVGPAEQLKKDLEKIAPVTVVKKEKVEKEKTERTDKEKQDK